MQELRRRIQGSGKEKGELDDRLKHIKQAILWYPGAEPYMDEGGEEFGGDFSQYRYQDVG